MSDVMAVPATIRERAGKGAARATRRAGLVPSVIYGDGKEPVLIAIDPRIITKELNKGTFFTNVYEIDAAGTKHRAIARDLQFHPVTDQPEHVDFLRVSSRTVVTLEIPVNFMNEEKSPGLKRGGVLNVVRHTVEVSCRADAIPETIDADLTGLEVGDSFHISAVSLPDGVTPTITDRDFTIATVAAPSGLRSSEAGADDSEGEGDAAEDAA